MNKEIKQAITARVKIKDLAERLNITRQTIYLWLKKPNGMPVPMALLLEDEYGICRSETLPHLFAGWTREARHDGV